MSFPPTSYYSLNYIGSYAFYQDNTENDWKSHTFAFDSNFGGRGLVHM